MASAAVTAPASAEELAAALSELAVPVRVRGAGTKLGWALPGAEPASEVATIGLDRIVEHNAGDLTAVLEAGVPLARAQAAFAEEGQMLALDPPDGGATIGGVVASADSGPLRARYGGVRDLVVGMRVALGDGTLARSGGKVIKNVAGYDLAKLFAGSFGRLGAILEVAVRLHPLPPATATAVGVSGDPDVLGIAGLTLSHAPLEQLGLDARWARGEGAVLARFGGSEARAQADAAERLLREAGCRTEILEDDEPLWREQRDGQRSATGVTAKVSALQTDLPSLARLAGVHGAALVGRAGLGLFWLRLDDGDLGGLVRDLRAGFAVRVLDRPPGLEVEAESPLEPGAATLMRRVKERFDPDGRFP